MMFVSQKEQGVYLNHQQLFYFKLKSMTPLKLYLNIYTQAATQLATTTCMTSGTETQ